MAEAVPLAGAVPPTVLVLHGDAVLRARLAAILLARGYAVATAPRADSPAGRPLVIVSDHRTLPSRVVAPVLAIVPERDEAAVVDAFARGADAVLAGPVRATELVTWVAVLARRQGGSTGLRVGPIAIDATARRVTLAGRPVELTRREYELLARLAGTPGRVFTKQELLEEIWAAPPDCTTRRLDAQVARLRRRLGEHRALLVTVWGVGYRLGG